MPRRTCEKLERPMCLANHNFSPRLLSKALLKKIGAPAVKYGSLTGSPHSRMNKREEKE